MLPTIGIGLMAFDDRAELGLGMSSIFSSILLLLYPNSPLP